MKKIILFIILVVSFALRVYRLNFPNAYVFDEVYHAFTAREYLKNSAAAWEWWSTPPKGVAFEWTHPPLVKEIMASSMLIFHTEDAWAWRIPGVILGTLSIFLVFKIATLLFKNEQVGLLSAFVFSLDGLNLVQSRTGMNDIYLVFFTLISLLAFLKNKFFISAVLFGLAISSKWSAAYILIVFLIIAIKNKQGLRPRDLKQVTQLLYFVVVPVLIYLITYTPFFLLGHNFQQFLQLQQQMWWYHTHLVATHSYASAWWTWPLNLVPVWYFVEYQKDTIANIFASGNIVLFALGIGAIFISILEYMKQKSFSLLITLGCFLAFWLPWAFSPRIMFLYHYNPSVPFLSMVLGYQLNSLIKNKFVLTGLLLTIVVGFIFIYPFLTGVFLPKNLLNFFFLTNLAKNPF